MLHILRFAALIKLIHDRIHCCEWLDYIDHAHIVFFQAIFGKYLQVCSWLLVSFERLNDPRRFAV